MFFSSYPVWRIIIGLSLIPAFATLYFRLTLPESKRYIKARRRVEGLDSEESTVDDSLKKDDSSQKSELGLTLQAPRKGLLITTPPGEKLARPPITRVVAEKKNHILGTYVGFSTGPFLSLNPINF